MILIDWITSLENKDLIDFLGWALAAVGSIASVVAWLFARREKNELARDNNKLAQENLEVNKKLDSIERTLNSFREDPTVLTVQYVGRYILNLEDQKLLLEAELETVRNNLNNLQIKLEQIYQEYKVDKGAIPEAEKEASVYRSQIDILVAKLDDVRSSIVLANSVRNDFSERRFDAKAYDLELQSFLSRMRNERALVGASTATFKGKRMAEARRAESAKAQRETIARMEERKRAEQRAERAHLKKLTIDEKKRP